MFSKPKPTPTPGSAPVSLPAKMATGARHTTFSILGADVIVTGNISATVDLHVDGRIEGDLACANLVQGEESLIKGAIVAETARLSGTVDGSITARDLTIQASARITGDVTYENLTIEQGSQVEGRFSHRRAGAGAATPAARPLTGGTAMLELSEVKPG
jgi:cytoskeletal protein CcmA (bactofilin family)